MRPTGKAPARRAQTRVVPGRGNPRAQAQRPVIKPTPGAPRKTSDWNIALSELGLGGGNKVGGAVKAAALPDFMSAWKPAAAKPKADEGHSVTGFLSNLAGEIKDTGLGLVETVYSGGKAAAQGAYGGTIGLIPGTGGDVAREAFVNNFNRQLDAVWATAKQTGSNWKSVVTGDFEPLYKNPLSMALDVASVATLGAGAAVKGAQVARAGHLARGAAIASDAELVAAARGINLGNRAGKAKPVKQTSPYPVAKGTKATAKVQRGTAREVQARPAWLQGALDAIPGGAAKAEQLATANAKAARLNKIADAKSLSARVRPNRTLSAGKTAPVTLERLEALKLEDGPLGSAVTVAAEGPGVASLPRRNLARGPIARQIQKGGIKAWDVALNKSPKLNAISEKRLSNKLSAKSARISQERAAQIQVDAGRVHFDNAVRRLKNDPMAKAAATLHLEGVLTARDGLSAPELRDIAVRSAEAGLAAERKAHPDADPKSYKQSERHIELLKQMPDELLTLEGDSKHVARVRQVVETGRNFDRNMSKHDPFNLSDPERPFVRDVRGERSTISQRVLLGGAESIDLGKTSRVMVRDTWNKMVRGGKVYASNRDISQTVADAAERAYVGDAPGNASRDFLRNTPEVTRRKSRISPDEEIRLLERVERGEISDVNGKKPSDAVRADAGNTIKQIKRSEQNAKPYVTAYRVRGADGGATHWVRETRDGQVPDAIRSHGKKRKAGDVVERAVVPANHWRSRQDEYGRVKSLGKSLENGTVRLKDGTIVGQRGRTATVRPGARADAARYTLDSNDKSGFLPRDNGYQRGGFAESLETGSITPVAEQRLRENLGLNKPRRKMTNEEIVIKNLVDAGHLNLREVVGDGKGRMAIAERTDRAIVKYTSEMFEGKIPLNADGQVNFDAMFSRLHRDEKLRDAYNDPRLLSNVETTPGVYMSHQAVGTLGGHAKASRNRQTTSTVGVEMGIRRNSGALAGRLGYSLDPVVMMHDANNISRIISSRDFVARAVRAWAVSDKNGNPVVMTAEQALRLDNDKYRAIPISQVSKAEAFIKDWNPEKNPDKKPGVEFISDATDPNARVLIFPADIAKSLEVAFGNPHGFWKKYDSVMQIWRSGILALTPRWYVNNYLGNTFFYGVYTGMDLTSLRIARKARKDARTRGDGSVIPHRISGEGMTSQGQDTVFAGLDASAGATGAGANKFSKLYYRATDRGYYVNSLFEGSIRDAAYVHAFRKFMKDEGKLPGGRRGRKQTDEEMLEALANAPDHIKQHVIEETERWMGDYRGLSRVERDVVRRAIPFYSWVRVINTWLFGMPFRSPLRAQALLLAGQIGRELQGDRSYLPWWEQGRIENFLGVEGWALRTSGANPLSSVMEQIIPFGMKGANLADIGQEVAVSFGGQTSPVVQALIGAMTGRKLFGDRAYTAPPGYAGTVQAFGKEPQYINTVTGQVETRSNRGQALVEGAFQMVPFAAQARDLLAWGKTPYDSSSTLELAIDRIAGSRDPELYQPPKKASGREKVPGLAPMLALMGLPSTMVDPAVEKEADRGRRFKFTQAEMQQRRLRGRQALKREGQGG